MELELELCLQMVPSPLCVSLQKPEGKPKARGMVISLSLQTNYCHQKERDRCALALRPAKGSEHELCMTLAIEIRVEWGKS